jgi:hypothetical protein
MYMPIVELSTLWESICFALLFKKIKQLKSMLTPAELNVIVNDMGCLCFSNCVIFNNFYAEAVFYNWLYVICIWLYVIGSFEENKRCT